MVRLYNTSIKWKEFAVQVTSLLFILLFTYAAVSKLIGFEKFHHQLKRSPFLTEFAGWLVWIIPAVQILISFLFISIKFRQMALYASFILMLIFTLYIFAVLNFAQSIPCSCGGVMPFLSWNQHLYFNLGMVFLAFLGIALSHSHNKRMKSVFSYK